MPKIVATITNSSWAAWWKPSPTFSGALKGTGANGNVSSSQQGIQAGVTKVSFDSSFSGASTDINGKNIYTNKGENRPENMTYKLWKRIA